MVRKKSGKEFENVNHKWGMRYRITQNFSFFVTWVVMNARRWWILNQCVILAPKPHGCNVIDIGRL